MSAGIWGASDIYDVLALNSPPVLGIAFFLFGLFPELLEAQTCLFHLYCFL